MHRVLFGGSRAIPVADRKEMPCWLAPMLATRFAQDGYSPVSSVTTVFFETG